MPGNGIQVGEVFNAGATIGYECYDGYHLVGEKFITCLPNGEWSGHLPSCEEGKQPQAGQLWHLVGLVRMLFLKRDPLINI